MILSNVFPKKQYVSIEFRTQRTKDQQIFPNESLGIDIFAEQASQLQKTDLYNQTCGVSTVITDSNPMKWYNYIAAFAAGLFLVNVVPHFIHGVSGDRFPSPFSNPPGIGLSSPTVNVGWALFNLVIGYLLFKAGKIKGNQWALLVFFLGCAAMSFMLSTHFVNKMPA